MADPRLIAQGEDTADAILALIKRHYATVGLAPSLRELAEEMHMTAGGVRLVLKRLEQAGAITLVPNISRGIVLTKEQ